MISTYRFLSEFILNQHYAGMPTPEHAITQRHIAERIAVKVAKFAKVNAFENSNAGDTTFANDQFVSVFYNKPLLTNELTGDKYFILPATPSGLPKNTEITQISFSGSPNVHVIPCLQKDTFMESLMPPLPPSIVLYKIETGNAVFINLPAIINSPVNVKMVGSISGATLLDSELNVPKDTEDAIVTEILQELSAEYNIPIKTKETAEPY